MKINLSEEFHLNKKMQMIGTSKSMLVLLGILFNLVNCLSGLNLSCYSVVVKSTNAFNVSSFDECLCKCSSSSDCNYFAYWSTISLSSCQIYSSEEGKPDIVDFTLTNYSNQTGLCQILTSISACQSPILNYTNTNSTFYVSTPAKRIISVIIMLIGNFSRLLAIDSDQFSYYIFDLNTFQVKIYSNIYFDVILIDLACR
jgi:hypothetical protein